MADLFMWICIFLLAVQGWRQARRQNERRKALRKPKPVPRVKVTKEMKGLTDDPALQEFLEKIGAKL